jgi:hypothetical protein
VQFNADKPGKTVTIIYDLNGNLIKQLTIELAAGLNNRYLSLGNLTPGIYKILFKLYDLTETKAIVVQ